MTRWRSAATTGRAMADPNAIRASMCRSSPVRPITDGISGELWTAGVSGVVVDMPSDRGEQRVGTSRVIAPAFAGEQGRKLHEACPRAGTAVLTSRQHREQCGQLTFVA